MQLKYVLAIWGLLFCIAATANTRRKMDCRHKGSSAVFHETAGRQLARASALTCRNRSPKRRLHLEYREMSLEEMLQGLENNQIDLAVAALTITPDREKRSISATFLQHRAERCGAHNRRKHLLAAILGLFSKDFYKLSLRSLLLCRRRAGLAGGTPPQSRTIWRHGDAGSAPVSVVGSHDDHRRLWR